VNRPATGDSAAETIYSYNIRIGSDIATVLFVDGVVSAPGIEPFPVGTLVDSQVLEAIASVYACMPIDRLRALLGAPTDNR
jgi:hypothetical protein